MPGCPYLQPAQPGCWGRHRRQWEMGRGSREERATRKVALARGVALGILCPQPCAVCKEGVQPLPRPATLTTPSLGAHEEGSGLLHSGWWAVQELLVCVCVCIYLCVRMRTSVYVCVCACFYVCGYMSVCAYICVYICTRTCVCARLSVCACLCAHVRMCMHVYVCVSMWLCVCIYLCVCVCVSKMPAYTET